MEKIKQYLDLLESTWEPKTKQFTGNGKTFTLYLNQMNLQWEDRSSAFNGYVRWKLMFMK